MPSMRNASGSDMPCTYCFFRVDGKPAPAVALSKASTFVFASSKLTTASAFSRLTSALVTPSILVNDLFTEITHDTQVIPDTESATVWMAAKAGAETTANMTNMAAATSFFMGSPFRLDKPHTTETPPARRSRSRRRSIAIAGCARSSDLRRLFPVRTPRARKTADTRQSLGTGARAR